MEERKMKKETEKGTNKIKKRNQSKDIKEEKQN
jgi:hypothetical protein